MTIPSRDYVVSYRTEAYIAHVASEWRRVAGIDELAYFNIVDFIERALIGHEFKGKGRLKVAFFDAGPKDDPAYVTYGPLMLHVDRRVWHLARLSEQNSRHIIAHEIGHIILHDHHAKAFSKEMDKKKRFAEDENWAEWQANRFADHFLVPDILVGRFSNPEALFRACAVPRELATERFASVHNPKRKLSRYSGEACPNCQAFTLVRIGLVQTCDSCATMCDEFGNILEEGFLI